MTTLRQERTYGDLENPMTTAIEPRLHLWGGTISALERLT